MPRRVEILFRKRNIRAVATLLDTAAPKTCGALWESLPLEGEVYHAKWANNEVYTLVPPLKTEPGAENSTIYPMMGDLGYFYTPQSQGGPPHFRDILTKYGGVVDLAIFYGRNNHLLGPAGYVPANVFGTITENLAGIAEACESVWREGGVGERLVFRTLPT